MSKKAEGVQALLAVIGFIFLFYHMVTPTTYRLYIQPDDLDGPELTYIKSEFWGLSTTRYSIMLINGEWKAFNLSNPGKLIPIKGESIGRLNGLHEPSITEHYD